MEPAVKRDGHRVWIEGVGTPPWGNWDENSVIACLSVVLPVLGEGDVSVKADELDGGWLGCHAIMPQVSGRKSVAVYLERVAEEFDDPARTHIQSAAKAYDAAFDAWQEWRRQLGGAETRQDLGNLRDAWSVAASREGAAAAARKALKYECAALEELKRGLAAGE